jgi:hypothetical protein
MRRLLALAQQFTQRRINPRRPNSFYNQISAIDRGGAEGRGLNHTSLRGIVFRRHYSRCGREVEEKTGTLLGLQHDANSQSASPVPSPGTPGEG